MIFETHVPSAPLSEFVAQFWFYEGLDLGHDRERVLPDGTSFLMVNLRDEPRRLFDRDDASCGTDFRRAWVSGTQRRHLVIDALRGSSLIGAQFTPGGLAPFLPLPASEVRDQVLELDTLLGLLVRDLRDALLEAPTPAARFQVFERFLLERGRGRLERSRPVSHALRRFLAVPHMTTIDAVADELGISHKHLIARFSAEVGVSPKRFCRIRRFQEVVTQIGDEAAVDWADLATACGYYDQAHFIQEFREFSGLNPSAYLRQRGEYRNFVPLED